MEFEKLVKKMLVEDPFYGFMLTTVERRFSDQVPTLAVHINRNMNAELLINKTFYEQLTDTEQMAVLKHELMHLAFHHLTMCSSFPNRKLFNTAADMEVNCYINGLPKGHINHNDFGLSERLGTMAYYRALSKTGQGTGGCETLDDHSVWSEVEAQINGELTQTLVNDILIRTASAMKQSGTIPAEMRETIDRLEKPMERVYDWKQAFRRFLGSSYSDERKNSRRKESKRFPGAMGKKHLKRASILVAIDTSGSVSRHELQEFASELTYLHKTGAQITVIECDAEIHREYPYKPGCLKEVSGRGGTDFEPVIDYYRKRYKLFDTLVFFTDGFANTNLRVPQNNMMWVISSAGKRGEYPGKTIYIPQRSNE